MAAVKIETALIVILSLVPVGLADTDVPGDYAVVVRDTRLFAGLEPYAEILGKVEAGQFFPVESVSIDPYGIRRAEVTLPDGRTGYLSDIMIIREQESVLRELLQRVNLADIGLWDDEVLRSVQERGIEIGFTSTQLLFAQGFPLHERERSGFREWFFPRLVVLIEDDLVVGFTRVRRLPLDRAVSIDLKSDDPEFSAVSGVWQTVELPDSTYLLAAGGGEVGRFRVNLPVRGTYRLTARWQAADGFSSRVRYRLRQKQNEIIVFRGNQRLYPGQWVRLGEFEVESGEPVIIDISAEDGKQFTVHTLRIRYVNKPVEPADAVETVAR